jgi:hypothetical protein
MSRMHFEHMQGNGIADRARFCADKSTRAVTGGVGAGDAERAEFFGGAYVDHCPGVVQVYRAPGEVRVEASPFVEQDALGPFEDRRGVLGDVRLEGEGLAKCPSSSATRRTDSCCGEEGEGVEGGGGGFWDGDDVEG